MNKATFILVLALFFISCQKEITVADSGGGTTPTTPISQKPKIGTTWQYRYYTFYSYDGSLATSAVLTLTAKSEDVYGGDTYLNIVDKATNMTVFLLKEKADGLYHVDNGAASGTLLCKAPAIVNETYNSQILGSTENFVVKAVKDSFPTGLGTVAVNYYQGSKNGLLFDQIWYNENAWIVQYIVYKFDPILGHPYYKYSSLAINSIIY